MDPRLLALLQQFAAQRQAQAQLGPFLGGAIGRQPILGPLFPSAPVPQAPLAAAPPTAIAGKIPQLGSMLGQPRTAPIAPQAPAGMTPSVGAVGAVVPTAASRGQGAATFQQDAADRRPMNPMAAPMRGRY